MRRRQLDAMEARAVEVVRDEVNACQAERVRRFLPLIAELLGRRKVTILTARADDLEAFCQERALTRGAPAMAHLIRDVQHLFRALYQSGLRADYPCKTLIPPCKNKTVRSGRPRLGLLEMQLIERVREKVSAGQADKIGSLLSSLTDFLRRRNVTLLTALKNDLQAFCDESAHDRKVSSLAILVSQIRTIFNLLLEFGIRRDDPSKGLIQPHVSSKLADYEIDQSVIEQIARMFAVLSSIVNEATGLRAFVAARTAAIVHLSSAGARHLEVAALNVSDAERAVNASGLICLGRGTNREREIVLTRLGCAALSRYLAMRRARSSPDFNALFVSTRRPCARVSRSCVHDAIRQAAMWTGSVLTTRRLRQAFAAAIVKDGPGWWGAKIAVGYRKIPRTIIRYFDIVELSHLLERHHPMGKQ